MRFPNGSDDERPVARVDDEPRHDRGAEPFGDEADERAVVVRAEDDVRAPGRGRAGSVSGWPVLRQPMSGTPDSSRSRRRRLARRELRAGTGREHVRVAEHLLRDERPLEQRQLGEGEVELAALEQAQEVGGVRLLADVHLDPRPRLPEAAQERGEDARADALVDADAQRPGGTFRQRGHVRLRGCELGDDRVGVAERAAGPPR